MKEAEEQKQHYLRENILNKGYDAKTEATSGDDVAADGWNNVPVVSSANATDVPCD